MKRFALLLLLALVLAAPGCAEEVQYPLDRYVAEAYAKPLWSDGVMYHESVLVWRGQDGTVADIDLLYPAEELLSVRSSDLQTQYVPGRDYTLVEGRLHIPEGSAIPVMDHGAYYPTEPSENTMPRQGGGYVCFGEGSYLHSRQIAVTYRHSGSFPGQIPACKADLLPGLQQKLRTGGMLELCVLGDSICTGLNSSGEVKAAPHAPPWYDQFADRLVDAGLDIFLQNPSQGGMTSQWGVEAARELTGSPELCILGFGMNDGTQQLSQQDYIANLRSIMESVRQLNPQCEFILVATMLPNPEAAGFTGLQKHYLSHLLTLEGPGVAVMDMTTLHESLLQRKRYCDMTGNNINHPNDFLSRAYAQVLWQTAVGED